jgi:putative membrane protein
MSWSRIRALAAAIAPVAVGLAVTAAVIGAFDVRSVLAAMRPIGALGFLAVILAQLALYVPLGLAWWLVAPGQPPARIGVFVWSSLMAEAASNLLPFSQLGGALVATRAAVLGGVPTAAAFGSNVVDITMELAAQVAFALLGVALLAWQLGFATRDGPLLLALLGAVAVAAGLVGAVVMTQRRGLKIFDLLARRLAPRAGRDAAEAGRVVAAIYGRPLRLWAGLGLHLIAWFATAGGAWLILAFIGRPLPLLSVAAIESLVFACRNAAFVVPAGLGVQEGAYVLLGPLFGLPAEAALALSLLKRARDVSIGAPMLLSWQMVEIGRRLGGRRTPTAPR